MSADAATRAACIAVKDLSISFGDSTLFSPVSFSVFPGETVALIGPSGVGKTSILRAISRLLDGPAIAGTVSITGIPSVVFQEDRLLPWCDLISNMLIPTELRRPLTTTDADQARELLRRMKLSHAERRLPGEVSGGMRQRVAIGRALVTSSPVLLLDEPFTALDFDIKIECQRLVLEHISGSASGCVLVTHDIDDAVSLASRIVALRPYPSASALIQVAWPDKPADPLDSRKTVEHFNLVRDILDNEIS
ncbi:MAG TPA: ABC transporter ATP-binding protein [Blastocatellia bacterium]|jgi:ABC-type nitrate/sulfonate/bicarbonate transport system ATPase subunit|nr:ABC transporter ATP-binding protein [Blastocatellia bacterium]